MENVNPSSRGTNWKKMKAEGALIGGRVNPTGKNKWEIHPDGHPDAGQLGIPSHHGKPHAHATNANGEELIITW